MTSGRPSGLSPRSSAMRARMRARLDACSSLGVAAHCLPMPVEEWPLQKHDGYVGRKPGLARSFARRIDPGAAEVATADRGERRYAPSSGRGRAVDGGRQREVRRAPSKLEVDGPANGDQREDGDGAPGPEAHGAPRGKGVMRAGFHGRRPWQVLVEMSVEGARALSVPQVER